MKGYALEPLYQTLTALHKNRISFHTPGHKHRADQLPWLKDLIRIDTTETRGTDNLLAPEGILTESLERIARITGATRSHFCVNGATGAIHMAQHMALRPGETLLVQRDAHKSVFGGAVLNRLLLDYLYPEPVAGKPVPGAVTPKQVEDRLRNNKKIRAVLVVSPNYYGITADLSGIAAVCRARDVTLIVDEAHGSHLHFSDRLPPSALLSGADLVVQSTHKTLPSLTQTALLHVGERDIGADRLREAHALFQTTSPSYVFMASIDHALSWMDSTAGRERLETLIDAMTALRERIASLDGFEQLLPSELPGRLDLTRLLFRKKDRTGVALSKALADAFAIDMEMADANFALALGSVGNTVSDCAALGDALCRLERLPEVAVRKSGEGTMPRPVIVRPLCEAVYCEKEARRLKDCAGRTAAQQITPYPPGVPAVVPGECITEEMIAYLYDRMAEGVDITGMSGPERDQVQVIQ